MMEFTARRQQAKKATIKASKQTVEDALRYAQTLSEYWKAENENDPRLEQLQDSMDFLSTILNKNPQEMAQDGVSTIEEYFDDTVKPDVANKVKQEVDMIAKWRRESHSRKSQVQQNAPVGQPAAVPARAQMPAPMASAKKADTTYKWDRSGCEEKTCYCHDETAKPSRAHTCSHCGCRAVPSKKADGGAAFSTDRDEKGVAKAPEKVEVPRLAAKDKKAQKPAATPIAPVTPPAPAAAPIPEEGTFDVKLLGTEALSELIKAAVGCKSFEEDKQGQALVEVMTRELKTRPIEQEEPKAAPAAAAPAAAPAPAPIPAPVASAKKKAADNPAQAQVSLGGLATAAPEEEPIVASTEKVAVTPPGISEELMRKLKGQYPGEKDKAYATAWKIHNEKEGSLKEAFAALDKIANAQGGSWFIGGGKPIEVTEDGGRTPEIGEAHSKLEDKTGIDRPATTAPITLNKQAAEMTIGKAVKESEKLGADLKRIYLEAKPLTNVNDTRPVREAVEAIFRAADLFNEATKVLSKQQAQVESEEAAAKIKAENKGKKSSFLGLAIAASE
jgi:hypothetical protein